MTKQEMLKPRLLECIARLKKLIELDAPAVIIGAAAWSVFKVTLSTYGTAAGSTMLDDIRERDLHHRGVCSWQDCAAYVDRPDVAICKEHQKELGLEDMEEVQLDEVGKENGGKL